MPSKEPSLGLREAAIALLNHEIFVNYRKTMYDILQEHDELKTTFPAFLIFPDGINIYFGRQHLVLELVGPNKREESEYKNETFLQLFDYREL